MHGGRGLSHALLGVRVHDPVPNERTLSVTGIPVVTYMYLCRRRKGPIDEIVGSPDFRAQGPFDPAMGRLSLTQGHILESLHEDAGTPAARTE